MNVGLAIGLIIAAAVLFAVVGFAAGNVYRKKTAEARIGSAELEAERLLKQAISDAEQQKKEVVLAAKEEIQKERADLDKEVRDRRAEVSKQERRLIQKEENLEKRTDNLEAKEESLNQKIKNADQRILETEKIKKQQQETLRRISGLTTEEAKREILASLQSELTHEKAAIIRDYEQEIRDKSDTLAREIITTAIQRCASDATADVTVSSVELPGGDEMKGRIIGREGRNIRTIESITGVDMIVDDTPGLVTISCFNPVKREIARLTLERLIADGRIHPTMIEETYRRAKREVEQTIKQAGERAAMDLGVNGLHSELIKMLGSLKYRTSYGQNVLNHSVEVAQLAGLMAAELGADVRNAKRAGLLHDIGKSVDREQEGTHVMLGVEAARKYHENEIVVNAIHAHHGDVQPTSLVACLVQAADAISASRPGARRENVQNYIKRLEDLENIARSYEGIDNCYALQAGREIRVMVVPENINDDRAVVMANDMAKRIEAELQYPGQIKVNLIREFRASAVAK